MSTDNEKTIRRLVTTLIIVLGLFAVSCEGDYPKYRIDSELIVPDSLKNKQANFVIEVVKSASYHMTGGDYEDPEDVIEQANETFIEIYSYRVECLVKIPCHGCYPQYTTIDKLSPEQLKIYQSIK